MNKIDKYVISAFDMLQKKDNNLPKNIHEITYVHRFAVYLENILSEDTEYVNYDIDLEYNRKKENENKILDKESSVRPDVIVHKRQLEDDLIVIEFKKRNISEKDKSKIKNFCIDGNYKYINGYCISIYNKQILKYNNGNWVNILGEDNE